MGAGWVFLITAGVAGAFIGSFLNVVIFRGAALWGLIELPPQARGDLIKPRSYCPVCRTPVAWFDLAPVLSYFALGGKCRTCNAEISGSYPAVEFLMAAAATLSVVAYGVSLDAALCALAAAFLIAIAETDRRTTYIPDALSMPFLWTGLLANLNGRFALLTEAVIGAAGAYAAFTLVAFAYRRLRGREGLGDGDAVLLAGIGAWCGWATLPAIVLAGASVTLLWIGARRLSGKTLQRHSEVAFGPGLCLAGGLALLFARASWNPFAA